MSRTKLLALAAAPALAVGLASPALADDENPRPRVFTAESPVHSIGANQTETVTVTCPRGTFAVSGGWLVSSASIDVTGKPRGGRQTVDDSLRERGEPIRQGAGFRPLRGLTAGTRRAGGRAERRHRLNVATALPAGSFPSGASCAQLVLWASAGYQLPRAQPVTGSASAVLRAQQASLPVPADGPALVPSVPASALTT